jgi:2-polyprenyl-6-methoxyphenol hydroxylase-like FAD-dependent oxidoreductase
VRNPLQSMTEYLDTEVLVIGGGPSGAACAIALARLRKKVVLCESAVFPRDHVGICLSPGILRQLEFLEAGSILGHPAHRSGFSMERRWESADFSTAPFEGIIADRGQLDFDLLAAATALGVRTLQPARVQNLTRERDGWFVDASLPSGMRRIRCSLVVDARGRCSRRFGRRSFGPATVAVYGEWRGEVKNAVRLAADDTS